MLPGDTYQPGRIIVVHGKAPGFPDTFDGSPIWVPSRGFRTVDMRYWSMCDNDFALPVPVVNCATDLTTDLQGGLLYDRHIGRSAAPRLVKAQCHLAALG